MLCEDLVHTLQADAVVLGDLLGLVRVPHIFTVHLSGTFRCPFLAWFGFFQGRIRLTRRLTIDGENIRTTVAVGKTTRLQNADRLRAGKKVIPPSEPSIECVHVTSSLINNIYQPVRKSLTQGHQFGLISIWHQYWFPALRPDKP
ncbi:hypothetical protein AQ951_16595 [Burkholderia pseudomallei]|nr:hypothetical protein EGY15_05360 [Burkholderia pseudomallei]OMT58011.1 hypothetical protein AQ761_05445 [Burkholderia pseudomallei]ONE58831.1 hypothetical protein AQ951_16595 [Burkholderia pseudomallei]